MNRHVRCIGISIASVAAFLPCFTAHAADESELQVTTVALPWPCAQAALGANGRLVALALDLRYEIAIFDVNDAKLTRTLEGPHGSALIAGGSRYLLAAARGSHTLRRWDCDNQFAQDEFPCPIPGGIRAMAMGHASDGPLLVVTDQTAGLIDPVSKLRCDNADSNARRVYPPPPGSIDANGKRIGPHLPAPTFRATADGQTFTGWGGWQKRLVCLHLDGGRDTLSSITGGGTLIGSLQGDELYQLKEHYFSGTDASPHARYTTALQPIGHPDPYEFYLPAVGDGLLLHLHRDDFGPEPPKVTLCLTDGGRTVQTFPRLPELQNFDDPTAPRTMDQSVYFFPRRNLLLTIPLTGERLVLRQIEIQQAVNRLPSDCAVVDSLPIFNARRGQRYHYALHVISKPAAFRCTLAEGPKEMAVTEAGNTSWDVPGGFAQNTATVRILVKNASVQTEHKFVIQIK